MRADAGNACQARCCRSRGLKRTTFDQHGRLLQAFDVSGDSRGIRSIYNARGYVSQQRYLHRDHLGSLVAISDEAGQIVTWMAFDPWGLRRNADAWHPWNEPASVYLNAMLAITPRGFTGHEHVDSAGIIHMNGRIYDPELGRFLQADPFVADSTTLNRYTYVHNNPLVYTDPSGYFSFKKAFKLAVVVGISVYTGGLASTALAASKLGAAFGYAVLGGALAGGISAGSLEGALRGAFAGAVFFGIGAGFDRLGQANLTALNDGKLKAGELVFKTNLKAGAVHIQRASVNLRDAAGFRFARVSLAWPDTVGESANKLW